MTGPDRPRLTVLTGTQVLATGKGDTDDSCRDSGAYL